MRVMLATICLNEMEWLPRLIQQHKDWPELVGWVFVEGCDPTYAKTNPDLVSKDGLSVDGTTEYLSSMTPPVLGGSALYIPCPYRAEENSKRWAPDQYKCALRNEYLNAAEDFNPDIIVQIDADEFYACRDQRGIVDYVSDHPNYDAWMFRQRHIWNPPYGSAPRSLFSQEVVGGYWQVPHTRVWRYIPGMRHVRNHNWPEVEGTYMTERMARPDLEPRTPECVHMGYAASLKTRAAKHDYYVARGEGSEGGRIGRRRSMYVECREAWEAWEPSDDLPHGARIVPYTGPVPEVFR